MQQQNKEEIVEFEEKAQELVSMTFALCEQRIIAAKVPQPPEKALAAAALSVQTSLNTFLAVTHLPPSGSE